MLDPQKASHKRTIEQFLKGEIEIHTEGADIVESMYNPMGLYKSKPGQFTIFLSGMRMMRSFASFPVQQGKLQYRFQNFPMDSRVPREVILQAFEGAIYPSPKTVQTTFVKASYSHKEL
jgi:hypothetical protein